MKNLRIVFMGSPEFAVATLGALLMNCFNVVAVVTSPDKPAGRGRKITKSAVKEYAEVSCLPIMQPQSLKDPEFINSLKELGADIFVVVAFRMLPEAVWKLPAIGTINLHASLLPNYRGAAPINHAIINGETRTGLTTFFIDDKIDTGKIIHREEVPIYPFENAGDLHDRLMKHGARLMIRTISELEDQKVLPVDQSEFLTGGETPKSAPKITPEFCIINWDNEASTINNFIRGLSPYPGARSCLTGKTTNYSYKIFEAHPEPGHHKLKPGTILSDGKHFLKVACRDGFISISTLQIEGKKKMNTLEFLRGFRIADFAHLVSCL
jgi:methionyl-tRNA formyltransferase